MQRSATSQRGSKSASAARGDSKAHVRDVRARLTQSANREPEFEHELLALFVRNELAAQWTFPVLALIMALAYMTWAPYWQAFCWLVIAVAAKMLLLQTCRAFEAKPKDEAETANWKRRLIIAEAVGGIALACFAMVGFGLEGQLAGENVFSSYVFMFAALIVVLAIRMTFASSVMPILLVGTVPITIAVVFRLLLAQEVFYLALAAMAVGVHLYFIFLARGLHTTTLSMLEFRAQKDLLIAELEEAKSISDAARNRAEAANLAKSRFLATMSHELRTPLNAILGFSEVMTKELMGPMQNPTYLSYSKNIHDSGSHLLNLINEILDLSRIEAGRFELNEERIHLCDIAADGRQLLKLRAETKGVELIETLDQTLPQIWADQRAIRQICLNLLSNAVKFTPNGGQVEIVVGSMPDGGQFMSVTDTGPGIPADELPKVLQAFGQGSLAHETAEGGTGLGLPIVKNLIELHGGRFELRSELRRGTEATIYVPPQRVLHEVAPLQPLGAERHSQTALAEPAKARHGRNSRLVTAARAVAPKVA